MEQEKTRTEILYLRRDVFIVAYGGNFLWNVLSSMDFLLLRTGVKSLFCFLKRVFCFHYLYLHRYLFILNFPSLSSTIPTCVINALIFLSTPLCLRYLLVIFISLEFLLSVQSLLCAFSASLYWFCVSCFVSSICYRCCWCEVCWRLVGWCSCWKIGFLQRKGKSSFFLVLVWCLCYSCIFQCSFFIHHHLDSRRNGFTWNIRETTCKIIINYNDKVIICYLLKELKQKEERGNNTKTESEVSRSLEKFI